MHYVDNKVKGENTKMVTLHTPEAPATRKQLWLLHLLTKTDTRNLKLTMQQASDNINKLKSNNGTRPLVNPHASAIKQDKQKLAQARYDKNKPEWEVIQGTMPQGETDIDKVNTHFMAHAYQLGRDKAGNDTATIDYYDFNCRECLFGKTGICTPSWASAGFVTCKQVIESVSFSCHNYESVKYSLTDYCHRPKGKRCHRNSVDNKCLECAYRKPQFRDGHNHTAWGYYIPTIERRKQAHEFWLAKFKESNNINGIKQVNTILALLNKLG